MDKEIAGMGVAVGAVGSEGERRSSTLSTALSKPRRNTAELDGRNHHNPQGRITLPCVRKTGCGT
jgi:hypothetical protein